MTDFLLLILGCWYSAVTLLSELTRTVAILVGNAFARIENDAVIAAAKLIASIALTKKQKLMNIGPLGTLSSILEKKNPISKLDVSQDGRSHLLKALEHNFLLIKRHSYKTLNAFYYHCPGLRQIWEETSKGAF